MKPPLSYFGGKQQLASRILRLIPPHRLYCEPFFGGGAVFFAKEPSPVEVINDKLDFLVNFYRVCQTDFAALQQEIRSTLHSRAEHARAREVYANPAAHSQLKRAWACWTLANQSFANKINDSWGYDRTGSCSKRLANQRKAFTATYHERLKFTQIEHADAVRVIKSRDTPDSFFYLDPPYLGTTMGTYRGYVSQEYRQLLEAARDLKGKFLLSSFPNEMLAEAIIRYRWHAIEIPIRRSMKNRQGKRPMKIEMLVANYPISLDDPT